MIDYPETHYKYSNLAQKVTGMPGCTVPFRYLANMLQNMFLLGSCKWKWRRPISPIYTYLSFCVGTFVVWCIAKFLHKFFYPVN